MTLSPTLPKTLAFAFLTLPLALTGCAITGTAELPMPRIGAPAAPNVASVPTPLADLFDFPEEALTSRASLVGVDGGATCFDVVIRRPVMLAADQGALPLHVSVDVDGVEASRREQTLPACAPDAACLPPDSALLGFTAEDDARVRVEGQRVCFAGLPRARRELVLSANPGKGAWRFRFRLTGEPR